MHLRSNHPLKCGDVADVNLSVAVDVGGIKFFGVFVSVERYVVELRKTSLNEGGVLNRDRAVAVCVAAFAVQTDGFACGERYPVGAYAQCVCVVICQSDRTEGFIKYCIFIELRGLGDGKTAGADGVVCFLCGIGDGIAVVLIGNVVQTDGLDSVDRDLERHGFAHKMRVENVYAVGIRAMSTT